MHLGRPDIGTIGRKVPMLALHTRAGWYYHQVHLGT